MCNLIHSLTTWPWVFISFFKGSDGDIDEKNPQLDTLTGQVLNDQSTFFLLFLFKNELLQAWNG